MSSYKEKVVTIEEALNFVKSNDIITVAMAAAEPYEFMMNIHSIAHRVKDVTITNCLPKIQGEYLLNFEQYKDAFKIDSWFYTAQLRKLQHTGRVSYIPNNLHFSGSKRLVAVHNNIFVSSASMPDEDGNIWLSASNAYEMEIARASDHIILEISPNIPHITGDHFFHYSELSAIVESDYYLPITPDLPFTEKDEIIGENIAGIINDGDCVQVGIGGIPNAVCKFLSHKKDLGVHTEMMTTGVMRLLQCGAVNNSKKQVDIGKTICCFVFGTQELYEYVNNNDNIIMRAASNVNDPYTISKNDNQVSINTTIEVDLTGQCCSESIGHVQFSGTGGQSDTVVGSQKSKNGRSIIALYSTAMVKNPKTNQREETSKIVAVLKPGAGVSLSRNDVDYIATEYGIVRLKGKSISERVKLLISIAHPKFRDELTADAKKYQLIV